jgi:ribosomal protein L15
VEILLYRLPLPRWYYGEYQYHQRRQARFFVSPTARGQKGQSSPARHSWLKAGFASQVHIRRFSRHKSRRSKPNPFLFRELQASHWYQVNAANHNKAAKHNMSETEVQALTKQLFDDDRLAKLIRNTRGWLGCSPKATTVSFQDRLKAYEDENQDAAWEIKIANAKEEAEKQTRQKHDRDPNSCQ